MDTIKAVSTNGTSTDPKTLARELVASLEAKDAALVYGLEPGSRAAYALQVAEAVALQHAALRKQGGINSEDLPNPTVVYQAAVELMN